MLVRGTSQFRIEDNTFCFDPFRRFDAPKRKTLRKPIRFRLSTAITQCSQDFSCRALTALNRAVNRSNIAKASSFAAEE